MRWLRSIAVVTVALAVFVVALGLCYEIVEGRLDARRFPQQGKLVDIGGYKLDINCTGQGSPTVVLESGFAMLSLSWSEVQSGVAKFSRVCSYDRAGYGWSDSSPFPQSSAQIAKELHQLLQNAGEKPPYVLVGHSFGGLAVRVFNGEYPNEVAGIVLVDSGHPDLLKRMPPAIRKESDDAQISRERMARFATARFWLGITRFEDRKLIDSPGVPYDWRLTVYLEDQPKYIHAIADEGAHLELSHEQAGASPTFGDKPLIVLTAAKGILGLPANDKDWAALQDIWINQLQVQLANLSTHGKRIMVSDSGHLIPLERPDAIVSAVREVRATVNLQ